MWYFREALDPRSHRSMNEFVQKWLLFVIGQIVLPDLEDSSLNGP